MIGGHPTLDVGHFHEVLGYWREYCFLRPRRNPQTRCHTPIRSLQFQACNMQPLHHRFLLTPHSNHLRELRCWTVSSLVRIGFWYEQRYQLSPTVSSKRSLGSSKSGSSGSSSAFASFTTASTSHFSFYHKHHGGRQDKNFGAKAGLSQSSTVVTCMDSSVSNCTLILRGARSRWARQFSLSQDMPSLFIADATSVRYCVWSF